VYNSCGSLKRAKKDTILRTETGTHTSRRAWIILRSNGYRRNVTSGQLGLLYVCWPTAGDTFVYYNSIYIYSRQVRPCFRAKHVVDVHILNRKLEN